ncbi:serine/threonine-protein kinase [Pimelobacter sp. 30-1]|uniref:serine/threonine-protein kinase n=1 Tax=Pimelobacter sp. 30-1 TaxID=2004991 RepID=UPI001C05D0C9|nr:serine/threonine-protein kinase [Pimelobacter sp. 30-1]
MSLPERLGRLRRIDRIGAGGFATVWLYHDDELDSPVAVKALADNWAQRTDVCDRFLEEARILRRADSDHVVRVYDIGAVDGTPYFVMSYADRGSLADLLADGPVAPERMVDLLGQAGEGVAVLHRHGVIHRDIKPQNLLLRSTPDGGERVLVADLGVAKAMLHASGLTQVVGTPSYMAPEQATGVGLDLRADVHALGAVGYHLLTGHLVREGGIGALATPELPPAPSRIADVPAAYDGPLLRALQLDPDDRWPDVPTFLGGLRSASDLTTKALGAPLPPPPPPTDPVESAPEPAPGRRGGWLRPLLLALLVLVVAFVVAYGATRVVRGDGGEPSGRATPAADITYPALVVDANRAYDTHQVRSNGVVWTYPVPQGWAAYGFAPDGSAAGLLAADQVDQRAQVLWRPPDEPVRGGYSLRARVLEPTNTLAEQVALKAKQVTESPDLKDVDVYQTTPDALYFTFSDSEGRTRFNFFRWLPDKQGKASLEVSVSGRRADKDGLTAMLDEVTVEAALSR